MIPLRKSIALVSLLAVLVPACSSSPGLIATIGTTQITTADIAELYETEAMPVDQTLRAAIFALAARAIIIEAAQTDLGVTLDGAKVDGLIETMETERDAAGLTTADYLGVDDAGEGLLLFNAQVAVLRDQVIRALATEPAYLDGLFADPAAITEVCAKHILLGTQLEAEDVIVELLGGADFATLADTVSLDSGSGGDLGCRQAAVYVDEFSAAALEAPLNEVFGPVQSEFGWHVIVVSERTVPTRDEVIADPVSYIASSTLDGLWEEWVTAELATAEVTVEPEYGTWSDQGIIPPTEPTE